MDDADRPVHLLGCGFGGLERDIAARAIAEAQRQAKQHGLLRLRYHVADLDAIRLPPASVDVVFAHSSVYHVDRFEALYAGVQRTLRPGGVFHLHEFVGPTRFQWIDTQLDLTNAFLDNPPPRLRRMPSGELRQKLRRPTIDEMISADSSEAIRSADLVGALDPHFDVIEERRIDGTLLHLARGEIAQNFDPDRPEDRDVLRRFVEAKDTAMASGLIGGDFAVITATSKSISRTRSVGLAWPGNAMPRSIATNATRRLPPARGLRNAIIKLNDTVYALRAHQNLMTDELAALRAEQSHQPPTPAQPSPVAAPAPEEENLRTEAELDRLVSRMLGEAASASTRSSIRSSIRS